MAEHTINRQSSALTKFHKRKRFTPLQVIGFLLLCFFSVLLIFPLLWMLSTSLKAPHEVMSLDIKFIPNTIQWNNYLEVFQQYPVLRYIWNTLFITTMCIVGKLLSCTLVAYGFAKYNAPGKNILFMVLLSTMMIPWAVTMVPLFIIFKEIGWYNTLMPLWVPSFFGDAFSIFLLRQFIMGVPKELEEAAKMDGANVLRTLWSVVVPNIKPALTVVAIFSFFYTWNDFLGPLIFLTDPQLATLQLGIQALRTQFNVEWHYMMALSVISIIPCLIVFFIGQKKIVEGITMTGIK
ncbi:carbohydrate ABC transporter permease [Gracilibacillus alcaliphilus]|uniref:carbohydrate ABC transporter permease n=1 Tax=Gracilibacillus alcaliphilus TaxID=1401441 RepID=UPI00195E0990|nr:carbohydrate ABC transporter permease [Gracilibacillus alcaliphilus]MBM7677635.1 ABC-type glycerol-3-phosphate transport system permease component [Gracilibacillus alcaliphilus]